MEELNMNNNYFKYKDYKKCYFEVGNYLDNSQAMSIIVKNLNGRFEEVITVNKPDYLYYPDTATIKNYSEGAGATKFLKKLGVIEEIYSSVKAHPFAEKNETIDYCAINVEKLKQYTKKFTYEWKI